MDAKGIPTVQTIAVDALDEQACGEARDRFGCERLVVKPPVSASRHRYVPARPRRSGAGRSRRAAHDGPAVHERDHQRGRIFDHAVRRRVQPRHREATEEPAIFASSRTLAAAKHPARRLRVRSTLPCRRWRRAGRRPLMPGSTWSPTMTAQLLIMELELIEPALWLQHAPDGGAAFASAVRTPNARLETTIGGSRKSGWAAAWRSSRSTSIRAIRALTGSPLARGLLQAPARTSAPG